MMSVLPECATANAANASTPAPSAARKRPAPAPAGADTPPTATFRPNLGGVMGATALRTALGREGTSGVAEGRH